MFTKSLKFIMSLLCRNRGADYEYIKNLAGDLTNGYHTVEFFNYAAVIPGSGTSDPTEDDATSNTFISTLTYISGNTKTYGTNYSSGYIFSVTTTYKNTTNAPIEVTELYLIGSKNDLAVPAMLNTDNYGMETMLIHEKLDEPVTLQPGETYAFTLQY